MRKVISTKFIINGQEYSSIDDMPPEVREEYGHVLGQLEGDRDGNEVPDFLENAGQDVPTPEEVKSFLTERQTLSIGLNKNGWKPSGKRKMQEGLVSPGSRTKQADIAGTIRGMLAAAALLLIFYGLWMLS